MKVGEVARRSGVNVETLRYYERRGLLPPPDREPSGHRRYDEDTVRFLRAIKEAQAVGFTLTEIGEYLRAARRSEKPSETLRIRMASKIDEIDSRIAGPAADAGRAGARGRMRVRLARPLHLRRGLSRPAGAGADDTADAAARDERGKRGQHPPGDLARRSGAALERRPPRGARAGGAAPRAAGGAGSIPLPLRLGEPHSLSAPRSSAATGSSSARSATASTSSSGSSTTCTTSSS